MIISRVKSSTVHPSLMKKKNINHSVPVNYEFTDFEQKVEDFH